MAWVECELSRLVIVADEHQHPQVVVLKEKEGTRKLPIFIGIAEAFAIHRRLEGDDFTRPLTHDLLVMVIEALGGKLEGIVVNDLRQGTFFGQLLVERDGNVCMIDTRPSDAIALAVRTGARIYVEEAVLDEAATAE